MQISPRKLSLRFLIVECCFRLVKPKIQKLALGLKKRSEDRLCIATRRLVTRLFGRPNNLGDDARDHHHNQADNADESERKHLGMLVSFFLNNCLHGVEEIEESKESA